VIKKKRKRQKKEEKDGGSLAGTWSLSFMLQRQRRGFT
jgi:hypothetical protein